MCTKSRNLKQKWYRSNDSSKKHKNCYLVGGINHWLGGGYGYGDMDMEIWSATDRIFCHFGLFFALLPPNNLKNQNFEKMKKMPRDIII